MSKGGEGGRTAWKALGGFSGRPTEYPKKVQQFMDDLIEGVWYVEGYRAPIAPVSKPEAVPAHCWDFLEIDFRSNRAAGGGLEYHVLAFYKPSPSDSKASKRKTLRTDTASEYAERVKISRQQHGHPPTVEEDEAWRKSEGIPRERMRELRRNTLTPEERKGGVRARKLGQK